MGRGKGGSGVNFSGDCITSYQKVGKNIAGGLRGALVIMGGGFSLPAPPLEPPLQLSLIWKFIVISK